MTLDLTEVKDAFSVCGKVLDAVLHSTFVDLMLLMSPNWLKYIECNSWEINFIFGGYFDA